MDNRHDILQLLRQVAEGAVPPEEPRFHLREGVLHCAGGQGGVGEGISMPLSPAALAALARSALEG